jgi:hypothetical protein
MILIAPGKTAGRLLWELQIASKLLRLQQRVAKGAMQRESSCSKYS